MLETFESDADDASCRYGYYPSRPWRHVHADVAHFAALATELAERNRSRDMVTLFEALLDEFRAAGLRIGRIARSDGTAASLTDRRHALPERSGTRPCPC